MQRHTFRRTIIADLQAAHVPVADDVGVLRLAKHVLWAASAKHNFACVLHYRLGALVRRRFPRIAALMDVQRFYLFGNDISSCAQIGPGFLIHHTSDIVIGRDAVIGARAHIYNGVTIGSKSMRTHREMPHIGDGVLIGTGAKVLGGITIGDGAVIGALAFCDKDIPAGSVAVGNPIRFLEKRPSERDVQ